KIHSFEPTKDKKLKEADEFCSRVAYDLGLHRGGLLKFIDYLSTLNRECVRGIWRFSGALMPYATDALRKSIRAISEEDFKPAARRVYLNPEKAEVYTTLDRQGDPPRSQRGPDQYLFTIRRKAFPEDAAKCIRKRLDALEQAVQAFVQNGGKWDDQALAALSEQFAGAYYEIEYLPSPEELGLYESDLREQWTQGKRVRDIVKSKIDPRDLPSCNQSHALGWAREMIAGWVKENLQSDFSKLDLESVPFGGDCLAGANFAGANLSNADFVSADLQGANLQNADLRHANFWRANLAGADLRNANLAGAYLPKSSLEGANLEGANLEGANCLDTNLSGANLSGANLQGASLLAANLEGADLTRADLRNADLTRANLRNANLFGANLEGATVPKKM
ncbi:MAG: pentapeptide repeat-containing protein, partial [Cyanobacteriota bacterium]